MFIKQKITLDVMAIKWVLHGSGDNETKRAVAVLEKLGVGYRIEYREGDRPLVLNSCAGRYVGLPQIIQAFGKPEDLTLKVA